MGYNSVQPGPAPIRGILESGAGESFTFKGKSKMIRKVVRCSSLSLLGLALASFSVGCQDANEAKFNEGGPAGKGTVDPKYAEDTPESYKQFHQDGEKNAPAKGKAGAPSGSTAPAK